MNNANLRTPDESRELWCATSNQMCRADECGHWYKIGNELEFCGKDDFGAKKDEFRSSVLKIDIYTSECAIRGRCGIIHE